MLYLWKKITKNVSNDINYWKIRDKNRRKNRSATHSICNLKFNLPNEIPVVFYNGSNHDYHFIIKESTNEFEEKFECLGENAEKYKKFSAPIKKEVTNIDKDGNDYLTKLK